MIIEDVTIICISMSGCEFHDVNLANGLGCCCYLAAFECECYAVVYELLQVVQS